MKSAFFLLALMLQLLLMSLVIGGCAGDSALNDDNQVRATVTAIGQNAPGSAGIVLVWRFEVAEGWHLYWPGRNDSGFPPTVELNLPADWQAGELQWPAPERHLSAGDILDHVYYRELVLWQEIDVPEDFELSQEFEITGEVSWLACKGMCVPGEAPVVITEMAASSADLDRAQKVAPMVWDQDILQGRWDGTTWRVTGPENAQLTFVPDNDCGRLVNLIADGVGATLAVRFKLDDGVVGPARGLVIVDISGAPSRSYYADIAAVSLQPEPSGG